eukprot:m.76336 g.76336  ORF g.76336 m.76336 type:complete len:438 (+) comp12484_c1_seq1:165-1478(+)
MSRSGSDSGKSSSSASQTAAERAMAALTTPSSAGLMFSRTTASSPPPSLSPSGTKDKKTSPKSSPLLRRLSTYLRRPKSGQSTPSSRRKKQKKKLKHPHNFQPMDLVQPTWCDVCDDVIWGLIKPCTQCSKCMYTCHAECAENVVLACQRREKDHVVPVRTPHPKAEHVGVDQGSQGLLAYLPPTDILKHIEAYNAVGRDNPIELLDDSSGKKFKGHIRVTLDLIRPVRVAFQEAYFNGSPDATEKSLVPPKTLASTSHSRLRSTGSSGSHDGETSFFLPKNVTKGLFVTSVTTAQEVISILLKKFNVISNPRKFALLERNLEDGTQRRLRRFEEPLALQLLWGANKNVIFCLQEYNDDHEFHWEEFSMQELENFLTILNREEQEASQHVLARYESIRAQYKQALVEMGAEEPDQESAQEAVELDAVTAAAATAATT